MSDKPERIIVITNSDALRHVADLLDTVSAHDGQTVLFGDEIAFMLEEDQLSEKGKRILKMAEEKFNRRIL